MSTLRSAKSRAARDTIGRTVAGAVRLETVTLAAGGAHAITFDAQPPLGIDATEFDSAVLHIEALGEARILPQSNPNAPAGALAVRLTPAPPQATAALSRIEIDGLSLTPSGFALRIGDACFLPGESTPRWNFPPQPSEAPLRLLLRPARGSGFAPPIAAAPAFPMPGAGKALYGEALGGAALTVRRGAGDRLDLVLTPSPALAGTSVQLLLGAVPPGGDPAPPNLPNEVASIAWRAGELRGIWQVVQGGVAVMLGDAAVATLEAPPVPGTALDFAPALRAALKAAIASATAPPELRITAPAATRLQVGVALAGLRWVAHPPDTTLVLQGAPDAARMPLAIPGPERLDATITGKFGPARLIAASDTAPASSRAGLVVAGLTQGARLLTLTVAEQALPIRRAAVFGRCAAPTEITLALHGGTPGVVGARRGNPVAIQLSPSATPQWHRAALPPPFLLPPHVGAVWLVLRARRGAFLWHAVETGAEALASADEGTVWSRLPVAPLTQLAVHDPGGPPGTLALRLDGALHATDIAGGQAAFRLDFKAPAALLRDAVGSMALGFDAARDADITVGEIDAVWRAGT